jgi:hypothetical protein
MSLPYALPFYSGILLGSVVVDGLWAWRVWEARGEYPNGGGESPSPVAGLEVRNLLELKGSALFFASFFKEKKEDRKIGFGVFGK